MQKEEKDYAYKSSWETAYLCASCGEYLSSAVTRNYWGLPCPRCGQVGTYCPDTIMTARRFVCTKKNLFAADVGYYEWAGVSAGGNDLRDHVVMAGRSISSPIVTIAAAGIASGLF